MWYLKNGAKTLTGDSYNQKIFQFLSLVRDTGKLVPDNLDKMSFNEIQKVVFLIRELSVRAPVFLLNIPLEYYKRVYGDRAVDERRFYNIGAGDVWRHPAWTSVDMFPPADAPHVKVNLWDPTPWPIESGSAKLVYSSHCIEHLDDQAVMFTLEQMRRICEPGATVRITAPDVDLFYREYKRNNRHFYDNICAHGCHRPHISLMQIFLSTFAFPTCVLSENTPQWRLSDEQAETVFASLPYEAALDRIVGRYASNRGKIHDHINWINRDKLIRMMRAAGFVNIEVSAFGQSRAAVMQDTNHFDGTCPEQSLYIEAEAP